MEIGKQLRNQALSSHSTKNVEDSGAGASNEGEQD